MHRCDSPAELSFDPLAEPRVGEACRTEPPPPPASPGTPPTSRGRDDPTCDGSIEEPLKTDHSA